jgi:hypothetical protein
LATAARRPKKLGMLPELPISVVGGFGAYGTDVFTHATYIKH